MLSCICFRCCIAGSPQNTGVFFLLWGIIPGGSKIDKLDFAVGLQNDKGNSKRTMEDGIRYVVAIKFMLYRI